MTIAYTFTITNAGPSTAASVALTATLPVGIEFSASSPGEPTCSASTGELICTLNALAPGGSTQVIVSGRVTSSAGGTVTTSAVAMGAASDSDLSNNAVTDLTFITMYRSFLPLILIHEPKPDLIGSLSLNPNKLNFSVDEPVEITVIVTNTGSVTAGPFWVDFYINPSTPPTKANMLWSELCTLDPCQGIAWYVTEGLAPGQSVQLTSRSYSENHSHWSGFFVPGTTDLYIYVDSWNPDSEHGLVQEVNEQNNRAELHGLTVSGVMAAQPALPRAADRPPRPLHDNARKQ
ncbi:MAG: hypothetical protein KatS3mg057_3062 [Herpetosiphonaceae bacterium]|nr:MAG: hypothetical protein KatS3mg057_3062 [Herpetosiphonaceae bacterium]